MGALITKQSNKTGARKKGDSETPYFALNVMRVLARRLRAAGA
jgi:hypothetical protein